MMNYATVNDLISLWRPLTEAESTLAEQLIEIASAEINSKAHNRGLEFESMVMNDEDLALVAKSVVVDVVKRYMNDNSTELPSMSQMTQSAGGYSVSGTFLVPGGGLFLKKSELSRLGINRQRFGVIDLCSHG